MRGFKNKKTGKVIFIDDRREFEEVDSIIASDGAAVIGQDIWAVELKRNGFMTEAIERAAPAPSFYSNGFIFINKENADKKVNELPQLSINDVADFIHSTISATYSDDHIKQWMIKKNSESENKES